MRSLEDWRQYLLGARHTFEIITDHSNLTYYREPQKLTRRQARWFLELQEYDFKLIHCSGTLNAKADILSRQADHEREENNNKNVTLLKPEWFVQDIIMNSPDLKLVQKIKDNASHIDKSVKKALDTGNKEWKQKVNGLIY